MAGDVSVDRSNSQDLKDLHEQYAQRRNDIIEKQQREINQLKKSGQQQVEEAQQSGEATVNHINKTTNDRINEVRNQSEERYTYERDLARKRLEALKQSTAQNEAERAELQRKVDIAANEDRKRIAETAEKNHQNTIETRARLDANYEKDRLEREKALNQLRQKYEVQFKTENEQKEQKLSEIQKQNATAVAEERDLSAKQRDQIANDDGQLIIHQRKEDDQKIGAEQTRFRKAEQQLKETDQQKIKEEQAFNQGELDKNNQAFQQRMRANQDVYEKTMAQKRTEYERTLKQNDKLNSETLTTQHDRLMSELTEQKKEVMRHYGKNVDQRSDPFYQVLKTETTLADEGRFFVVETKVPEKDRDNVDVRIHKDRVVVSGKREFNDRLEDGDRRLTTNNYQTFREEVKLPQPVDEKSFTKTYDNGVLRLKIAKV